MHPEIKKYFEYSGYRVISSHEDDGVVAWWIAKDGTPIGVGWTFSDLSSEWYLFLDRDIGYTEEQALRILKLKAFW